MSLGVNLFRPTHVGVIVCCLVLSWSSLNAQQAAKSASQLKQQGYHSYRENEYLLASRYFQLYVDRYSNAADIQKVLFMLGESSRKAGRTNEAKIAFQQLIAKYQDGSLVGDSAYRLGVIYFYENLYDQAAKMFALSTQETNSESVSQQALYFRARSLQNVGQSKQALALFQKIISANGDGFGNHFVEKSYLEAARILVDQDQYTKASAYYRRLRDESSVTSVREEAIARSGFAALQNQQIDQGIEILRLARRFSSGSRWRFASFVGAMFSADQQQDYQQIIDIYENNALIGLHGEFRTRVLSIVEKAYRNTGQEAAADRLYTKVGIGSDDLSEFDLEYQQLVELYHADAIYLPTEVEKFTRKLVDRNPESHLFDKANLLLAEWHFVQAERLAVVKQTRRAKDHYLYSAEIYGRLREGKIDPNSLPTCWFHQCWAYLEAGDSIKGSEVIDRLVLEYPDHSVTSAALAKRGETYMGMMDYQSARADFNNLVENYPDARELELALERLGRIDAHLGNHQSCVKNYLNFLRQFPDSKGRGEANFWIGNGYFEQKKFSQAIEFFEKALKEHSSTFANKARIRLIYCYNETRQIPKLIEMCHLHIRSEQALKSDPKFAIPERVLISVARRLAEKGEYTESEYFFKQVADAENPESTSADVWVELGLVQAHLGKDQMAIGCLDHAVSQAEDKAIQGVAYLERARIEQKLGKSASAKASVLACLKVARGGRTNAEARILMGDLLLAEQKPQMALSEYQVVQQIFKDPEISPRIAAKIYKINQLKEKELTEKIKKPN